MLSTLFDYPTGIPSTLLALVLLYWLLVVLGALDIDLFEIDLDGDAELGQGGSGLLGSVGLAGVPITVSLSLAVLFGWLIVALASRALGEPGLLAGLGILAAGGAGGLFLAGLAVRPLRPLFAVRRVPRRASLVGKTCVVTTLRVDQTFGQARLDTRGSDLLLQVRAEPDERNVKGARVLIVDFDAAADAFRVIPYDDDAERALLENRS